MINVAETLLTGRCGSVLTDTGQTPNFSFDSGTPQGAPESAFFFCIALEPLLIKLKMCPTIEKIEIPSRLFPTNRETLEGVAFADDASEFIKATGQNLSNFKLILDNFFRMTCLGINVEKTTIIPIAAGNNVDFIRSIEESGFSVDSKFKLLGYKIDNKLEKLHENIECVMEKLTKISSFWSKFKLSLPGRINIYKCYMLSNINFICSVIPTRKSDFDKIDQKCFNFVNGDMQTSFKKAFSPISDGGLGLIHSYDFCIANRVGLFKRSLMSDDTWALVMKNACHGSDPFYIDAQSPILIENPHASLIAKAYDAFYTSYIGSGMNIVNAPVFDDYRFLRDENDLPLPSQDFLTDGINENNPKALADIRLSDLLEENSLSCKSRNALEVGCNLFLNMPQYFRIKNFTEHNVLKKRLQLPTRAIPIFIFFGSTEKGSKKYRIIMEKEKNSYSPGEPIKTRYRNLNNELNTAENIRTIGALGNEINTPLYTLDKFRDRNFFSTLKLNFIWNHQRDKFARFLFSRLLFGNQIENFNDLYNGCCLPCKRANIRPVPRDSIYHLILTCKPFNSCINAIQQDITAIHANFKLYEFLIGTSDVQLQYVLLINVLSLLVINFSHTYRKSTPCPTPAIIRSYINKFLNDFSSSNRKFRLIIDRIVQKNNLPKNNCIHPQHLAPFYP